MSAPDASPFRIARRVLRARPSATLAINELSAALQASGRDVFRLGFGESPFPVPAPVVDALRRHATEKSYLPVRGLQPLREAIVSYLDRFVGLDHLSPDDIIVGPGSKELFFHLQLVLDAEILLPRPSWVSYAPQAAIAGRDVRWIDTLPEAGWRLAPEALDRACAGTWRPRLLVLNHPNNPAGTTLDASRLEQLARVARTHRLVVLSDEIYGALDHRGTHQSFARYYPEGTLVSGGLSKWAGAGGWRLGYLAAPAALRRVVDAMAVVASESYSSASAPVQRAAIAAYDLDDPAIAAYRRGTIAVLRAIGAAVSARLGPWGYPLDGGFYALPDFSPARPRLVERGLGTSAELADALLRETGVATLPGTAFGLPPDALTLRLAWVDFDGAAALAAEAGGTFSPETHAPRVLEAIDRLVAFVSVHASD